MSTQRTIRDGLTYLIVNQHDRLIGQNLSQLHLYPGHQNYDDAYQEGCLAYAKAYQTFTQSPEDHPDHFRAYAYRQIKWTIIDWLRKTKRQLDHQAASNEDVDPWLLTPDPKTDLAIANAEIQTTIAKLYYFSTPLQQQYLDLILREDLSNGEIAKRLGISRAAVYGLRRRVQEVIKYHLPELRE